MTNSIPFDRFITTFIEFILFNPATFYSLHEKKRKSKCVCGIILTTFLVSDEIERIKKNMNLTFGFRFNERQTESATEEYGKRK